MLPAFTLRYQACQGLAHFIAAISSEYYTFIGYFGVVEQKGDGNCVYYTLAGIDMPHTLKYSRVDGIPTKPDEWLTVQNAAHARRKYTADMIDKYDAAGHKDQAIETLLSDAMITYRLQTRTEAVERIRKVNFYDIIDNIISLEVGAANLIYMFMPKNMVAMWPFSPNMMITSYSLYRSNTVLLEIDFLSQL